MKIFENDIVSESGSLRSFRVEKKNTDSEEFFIIPEIGERDSDIEKLMYDLDAKKTVSFDLKGFGHSDGEKGDFGSFSEVLNDIMNVLDYHKMKNVHLVGVGKSYLFILFLYLEHEKYFKKKIKSISFIAPKIFEEKVLTKFTSQSNILTNLLSDLYVFNKETPVQVKSYLDYIDFFTRLTEPLYFIEKDIDLYFPKDQDKRILELFDLFEESIINAKVNKYEYKKLSDVIIHLEEKK